MHVPFPSIKRCPKWTKISTSKIAPHIVGRCSLLLSYNINSPETFTTIGEPMRHIIEDTPFIFHASDT